jgi:hypothetical protein
MKFYENKILNKKDNLKIILNQKFIIKIRYDQLKKILRMK